VNYDGLFQKGLSSAARVPYVKAYYYTTYDFLYYMPIISVRITVEQKRRLAKHGNVSATMRDAVRRYLDDEDSEAIFARLRALQQENGVKTTREEIVRMIREDRLRDSR